MAGTFENGATVGSCRILRCVGSGAMGTVYEVEHVRLGVRYALKAFSFEGADAEFRKKRFLAEGRILARLSHPRIVRVYDMDTTGDRAWFTMDYVEGPKGRPETLADVPRGGTLPEATLGGWYEDIREALAAVHAAGIVHRDVKLENILVDKDGRAVLSDFGISRIVDEKLRRELEVTRTMVSGDKDAKVVLGTVAYLAPEIRQGGEPTPAADLYALGVAFFRLLTGLWYEPGPHAFDLLAPFDRWWKTVLSALLAEKPDERKALPLKKSQVRRSAVVPWALVGILSLALLVALLWRRQDTTGSAGAVASAAKMPSVEVEDVFAIPDSVK